MYIWIIPIIIFFVVQGALFRRVLRFKRPIRLAIRQATHSKPPVENVSAEFAQENPHGPNPSRDYGEYSMGKRPSAKDSYGEQSIDPVDNTQQSQEGASAPYVGEGRLTPNFPEEFAFAATKPVVYSPEPVVNYSSFSSQDWRRAFVLSVILGPPGGRRRT